MLRPFQRGAGAAAASAAVLAVCLLPLRADALPVLEPCEAGGRGGRWGLCAEGSPIALRGSNYIRLGGPNLTGYHSTFDAGEYNRTRYNAAFRQMQADKYNINRVFLDELPNRGIGGSTNSTAPLDPAWVDRLAQYVQDAEAHGIYTIATMVYVPNNAYFRNFSSKFPPLPPAWGPPTWNTVFLTALGHAAFAEYASQLASALRARLTPGAQAALLVSLQNEYFLRGDLFPFGERKGVVTTADGKAYDMSVASERQACADANTNLWAQKARAAARAHLPSSLVFVGVFTFQAVHKSGPNGLLLDGCEAGAKPPPTVDCRFPARPSQLVASGVDFLDVHIYMADGTPGALAANLATEEWSSVPKTAPVVMGEFGCNWQWYGSATVCAPHVRQLQRSSCGQGFSGWLYWTYDCAEQKDWYTLTDDRGAINGVLAPVANPDPCAAIGE